MSSVQASSGVLHPGLLSTGSLNGGGNGSGPLSPSSQIWQGRLGAPQPVPAMAVPVPVRQPELYNTAPFGDAAFGLRGGDARSPPDVADHPMLDSQDGSQTSFELTRQNPLFQSELALHALPLLMHRRFP